MVRSHPAKLCWTFLVRGQRPESFQESLLRGVFGEPLISGDPKGSRRSPLLYMTPNQSAQKPKPRPHRRGAPTIIIA